MTAAGQPDWADLGADVIRGQSPDPEPDDAVALAAIPEYPTHVLPEPMRRLVETAGSPPALVAGATLAALAAAVGPRAVLQYSSTWEERAIVWPVLIAPPDAGKSPALRIAMAPVRSYDEEVWRAFRPTLEAWRQTPRSRRGRGRQTLVCWRTIRRSKRSPAAWAIVSRSRSTRTSWRLPQRARAVQASWGLGPRAVPELVERRALEL